MFGGHFTNHSPFIAQNLQTRLFDPVKSGKLNCLYFILTPRCFPEPNRINKDKAGRVPFLLLTSSNTIITKNKKHGTFQNYREDVKAL